MISHLADKELLYESYLNGVIVSSLYIVKCKGNHHQFGCLQPIETMAKVKLTHIVGPTMCADKS